MNSQLIEPAGRIAEPAVVEPKAICIGTKICGIDGRPSKHFVGDPIKSA